MTQRLSHLVTPILAAIAFVAATAASPAPTAEGAPLPADAEHAEWGYVGATGPDHWAELSQSYRTCSLGQQESPIDLHDAIAAKLGPLRFRWHPMPLHMVDNGHDIEAEAAPGNQLLMSGQQYDLVQFHVHHPSEHLLAGRRFPLEIHFVHRRADGVTGVVGVFVTQGHANAALQQLVDAAATPHAVEAQHASGPIDPNKLLPHRRGYLRYEGSLTTPPCTESVDWAILQTPITASTAQIAAIAAIYPFNARPIQPLARRFLLSGH